jgi:hypothetical protein
VQTNNPETAADKALETAIRACKASIQCSCLYDAIGCPALSAQWKQEAVKVLHYLRRNFPLESVIRICDGIEVTEPGGIS